MDVEPPFIIALIGPSGAGKSEIAARLAEALNRPLVDTDALVVEREGRSIAEIFEQDCEAGFRIMESEAVAQAVATPEAVVACGGGVVLDPANVEALRSSGVVVYLKTSAQVAADRLGSARDRPLLNAGPVQERVAALISERRELYEKAADATVDANRNPQDVVDTIMGLWESVSQPNSPVAQRWRLRP